MPTVLTKLSHRVVEIDLISLTKLFHNEIISLSNVDVCLYRNTKVDKTIYVLKFFV